MKKSIFKDGSICYGVDYSKREDCEEVVEITQEQYLEETRPVFIEPIPEVLEETESEQVIDEPIIEEDLNANS